MTGVKLKPCPFCGGVDVDEAYWHHKDDYGPGCFECAANTPTVEQWNSRPIEDRQWELLKDCAFVFRGIKHLTQDGTKMIINGLLNRIGG